MTATGRVIALGAVLVALGTPRLHAQGPAASLGFTAAQADAGKKAYAQDCAGCHGANMDDGEFAPPLKGAAFLRAHAGKPVGDLFIYMTSKMPPGNPGSLGNPAYAQILAYVLQQNRFPAGCV